MTGPDLIDLVHPSWVPVLAPVAGHLAAAQDFMRAEVGAGRDHLPAAPDVLRAFAEPLDAVRVLMLGQDPYPTPGHAVGLAFSVGPDVRPLPQSLRNILRERHHDLGLPVPTSGDLTPWTRSGVMLLNRVLTVAPFRPGSHRKRGWEQVTEAAVRGLAARRGPLVAVLWGRDAQTMVPALGDVPWISSAHPSPLSASRGFFGSRPFSRADAALQAQGGPPVDWSLPSPEPNVQAHGSAARPTSAGTSKSYTRRPPT